MKHTVRSNYTSTANLNLPIQPQRRAGDEPQSSATPRFEGAEPATRQFIVASNWSID